MISSPAHPQPGTSQDDNEDDRDLSQEEMDKLVQLQDLTGIDDLQICRALLESKEWDLEATAREHLNIPTVSEPPFAPVVPPVPLEAPEARVVMRPNHTARNRQVVPLRNSVFSW